MTTKKVIFSGVAWTIIQNAVSILYGIISIPFLISYFGKEEYGLIGIALSVNVYIQLLDMGMTNSNVRFFSEFIAKDETSKIQKLFSLTFLFYLSLGILNSIILFGLSFFVDNIFVVTIDQAVTLRNLLWILALNATFSWVSVCFDQLLRAEELISWIKKRGTLLKLLQFAILGLTIYLKLSIEVYFIGYIFIITAILPWSALKMKKILPSLRVHAGFDREIFKIVLPYAVGIFSFGIFQFTALNSRPLFLGGMDGPAAVADYNIMNTIAMVVTVMSGSFMQVLLPIMTKMVVKEDRESIERIIKDGTKYVVLLLSSLIFILIVCIDNIFSIYVGEEYIYLSKWMIIWLLTLLLSHRNVMTSLVLSGGEIKSISIMGAVAMCAAIGCYFIFIPIYGIGGIVIGYAVHELIHTAFYYSYYLPTKYKINTIKIFKSSVMPYWILCSLICYASSYIFDRLNVSSVCKIIFVSLLCFFFVSVLFLHFHVNKKSKLL